MTYVDILSGQAMKKFFLLLLLLNSLLIGACSTVATEDDQEITEQSLKHDRRTREAILIDKEIETEAYSELNSDDDILNQCHVTITAYNGAVLVTGETPNEELRKKIISTVQVIPNVKLIHNDLIIANPSDSSSRANDTFITDRVKKALNQIRTMPDFDPSMVKAITENGIVYLMGLVRRDEGTVVINVTRLQPDIKQIVTVFEYID
ncbi:MAG: putative periplasmic or secreted lipoprotein [Methylococcaceae bacterium NSM2-1]|nr:MAG: putative periplasmic or secreted lipoprotein [Methylococcaceae bacterium NSM2-1]